jgi:hypothetical protein
MVDLGVGRDFKGLCVCHGERRRWKSQCWLQRAETCNYLTNRYMRDQSECKWRASNLKSMEQLGRNTP